MRLQLPGNSRAWGKYVAELLLVAAGVALGLAATQWAENRQVRSEVNDAYDVLSDELGDNLKAVRYRQAIGPCVRRRIADLRGWIDQQSRGGGPSLPADIGTPRTTTILDSVWDVSKSGQVVAQMPLEVRRRYAAVYDLFEEAATLHRLEREVWFAIGDHAGMSGLTPVERARLSGLVARAETYNQELGSTFPTLVSDLARLKVETPDKPLDMASLRQRAICQPFGK
jgi:hypothetical protein